MEFFVFFFIGLAIGSIIYLSVKNSGSKSVDRELVYSAPKAKVMNAITTAASQVGLTVENVDEVGGRIRLKAGMSLTSWGEYISIQLMENNNSQTRVVVNCDSKSNGGSSSRNRKLVEDLLDAVSKNIR